MAAAQAQLQAQVQDQSTEPFKQWTRNPLFGDIPAPDGLIKIKTAYNFLHTIVRGGGSLGSNVEGNDQGAGGGGNATIQAQHADRNAASLIALLSI